MESLVDLRTPTPFTYTLSGVASGCKASPSTYVVSFTWNISGTTFQADNTISIVYSTDGLYTGTCVFPGMTPTSLFPGETLTLVKQIRLQYYGMDITNSSSWTRNQEVIHTRNRHTSLSVNISFFVPTNAIPYSTPTSTTPAASSTSAVSPSTSTVSPSQSQGLFSILHIDADNKTQVVVLQMLLRDGLEVLRAAS